MNGFSLVRGQAVQKACKLATKNNTSYYVLKIVYDNKGMPDEYRVSRDGKKKLNRNQKRYGGKIVEVTEYKPYYEDLFK